MLHAILMQKAKLEEELVVQSLAVEKMIQLFVELTMMEVEDLFCDI